MRDRGGKGISPIIDALQNWNLPNPALHLTVTRLPHHLHLFPR